MNYLVVHFKIENKFTIVNDISLRLSNSYKAKIEIEGLCSKTGDIVFRGTQKACEAYCRIKLTDFTFVYTDDDVIVNHADYKSLTGNQFIQKTIYFYYFKFNYIFIFNANYLTVSTELEEADVNNLSIQYICSPKANSFSFDNIKTGDIPATDDNIDALLNETIDSFYSEENNQENPNKRKLSDCTYKSSPSGDLDLSLAFTNMLYHNNVYILNVNQII
jgi:hypothetical protein